MHLQPRDASSDGIHCSLSIINLDEDSGYQYIYEALSYEWGIVTDTSFLISIDGTKVSVRENLWWALWYLRHPSETRLLWVDALCIDQENGEERNHQVSQMGQVYSKASRVIAWLGRASDQEDFIAIERFCHQISDSSNAYPMSDQDEVIILDRGIQIAVRVMLSKVQDSPFTSQWNDLVAIFRKRYWTRLWIVQELILGRGILIQCSENIIPWEVVDEILLHAEDIDGLLNLESAVGDTFDSDIGLPRHPLAATVPAKISQQRYYRSLMQGRRSDIDPATLFDLFHAFQDSECTEEVGKLYGMHSLAPPCCQLQVPVDYSNTLPDLGTQLLEHELLSHISESARDATEKSLLPLVCSTLKTFNIISLAPSLSDIPYVFATENPNPRTLAGFGCHYMGTTTLASSATHKDNVLWRKSGEPYEMSLEMGTVFQRRVSPSPPERWAHLLNVMAEVKEGDLVYKFNGITGSAVILRREGLKLGVIGEAYVPTQDLPWEKSTLITLWLDTQALFATCLSMSYDFDLKPRPRVSSLVPKGLYKQPCIPSEKMA